MADKNEKQKKGTEGGIEEDSGTAFTTGYDEKVVSAEGEGDAGVPPENHESDASPSGAPDGEEIGAVLKKVNEMKSKTLDTLKTGTEKIGDISNATTRLAKLKYSVIKIKKEREKLYTETGKKLWDFHRENRLREVEESFSSEFSKYTELNEQIASQEKEIEELSLLGRK